MKIKIETCWVFAIGFGYQNRNDKKLHTHSDEFIAIILPFIFIVFEFTREHKQTNTNRYKQTKTK